MEDINLSYTGMMNALTQTFSGIMKECIESETNISNNFDFKKYELELRYDVMTIESDERKEAEQIHREKGIIFHFTDYVQEKYHAVLMRLSI